MTIRHSVEDAEWGKRHASQEFSIVYVGGTDWASYS